MKIAYFDCFAGISGDMLVGALMDAGASMEMIDKELGKLKISGYSLEKKRVLKNGISGTKFDVNADELHHHRHLKDIVEIINSSSLDDKIKKESIEIFDLLADAEAKIHGKRKEEVHFHEVGAVDSIIDIVGAVIALNMLGIEKVYASPIHTGTGFVNSAHGKIPVPSPATAEILQGVPVYSKGIRNELVTPTGAAIIKYYSTSFGEMPLMKNETTGYGAGSRDIEIPNLLRVFIGHLDAGQLQNDEVHVIETNIDDMNPEFYDHISGLLFDAGALDVYTAQVIMKKSRPGIVLTVICNVKNLNELIEILLMQTTSSGVRINKNFRYKLEREIREIYFNGIKVNVKVFFRDGKVVSLAPEYEDCKKIAKDMGVSIMDIYDDVKYKAREEWIKVDQ